MGCSLPLKRQPSSKRLKKENDLKRPGWSSLAGVRCQHPMRMWLCSLWARPSWWQRWRLAAAGLYAAPPPATPAKGHFSFPKISKKIPQIACEWPDWDPTPVPEWVTVALDVRCLVGWTSVDAQSLRGGGLSAEGRGVSRTQIVCPEWRSCGLHKESLGAVTQGRRD